MNDLTIIRQNGGAYIDSREVAEVIGKPHNDLMKAIRKYSDYLTAGNFSLSGFFVASTYFDSTGRELPCYLISKMGCEMVANKLTGEKGILFTAAYVTKFNEMEAAERAALEALAAMPTPRLGEINACARIIVQGLKWLGATPERIMGFLKETYEPLGFAVDVVPGNMESAPRWYKAGEIAKECGLYSLYGKPHGQAVSCILNENLFVGAEHKRVDTESYGDYIGVCVRYDDYALESVWQWYVDNDMPDEVYGFGRTYRIQHVLD